MDNVYKEICEDDAENLFYYYDNECDCHEDKSKDEERLTNEKYTIIRVNVINLNINIYIMKSNFLIK